MPDVKDRYGKKVPGVGRLVAFSVGALLLSVLFFVWGRGMGDRGWVELACAVVIWAGLLVLWLAAAVTQWKRRNLVPDDQAPRP
jgi:hypothetical protein